MSRKTRKKRKKLKTIKICVEMDCSNRAVPGSLFCNSHEKERGVFRLDVQLKQVSKDVFAPLQNDTGT